MIKTRAMAFIKAHKDKKTVLIVVILVIFIIWAYFSYIKQAERKDLIEDINFIITTLSDENEELHIREKAITALTQIGKPALGPLLDALQNGDDAARMSAAFALGVMADRRAERELVMALKDGNKRVRYNALVALDKIGYRGSIEPIASVLRDESPAVRIEAVRILGQIGGKKAIEHLITLLNDSNWGVKEEAYIALKEITHKDLGWDGDSWLKWWQSQKNGAETIK